MEHDSNDAFGQHGAWRDSQPGYDFQQYAVHDQQGQRQDDDASSLDSIQRGLRDPDNIPPNDNGIVTDAPDERFRLGYMDVVCLVLNRMIGSGIFMTPQKVMAGTNSSGAALLFWFFGVIYAMSGMHVYVEFGMNVPRIVYNGIEQSVPRSGGDLNYLQYVYRWIGYRGQTVLFITCLFGIAFIVVGNMAGNCINFAIWVTRAAGKQASEGAIRGIALAVATGSCCIHAISRRGGIWLNDLLAIIKIGILLLIIVTAIIVAAGGTGVIQTEDVFSENMNPQAAFSNASRDPYGYAAGFLSIIFAFSGFEQPNYVLGEIRRPRRTFPISMVVGTGLVCLLYMATNISYMAVVPSCLQVNVKGSVAEQFFNLTYSGYTYTLDASNSSHCSIDPPVLTDATTTNAFTGYSIFAALVAISSLGNVVVMTFTAARVKQEIAKQGVLPWSRFFAHNRDVSVGRLLKWFRNKGWFLRILKYRWFSPEEHMEKTPVGALLLHELSCIVLLLATLGMKGEDAYNLLTGLAAYIVNAFFGVLLAVGILVLRFHGAPATSPETRGKTWTEMAGPGFKPLVSVSAAAVYLVGNAWPIVNMWIPADAEYKKKVTSGLAWYTVPTASWVILAVGSLWFLGFLAYAKRRERNLNEVFTVERAPEFESAEGVEGDQEAGGKGGLVLVHETVYLAWQAKEIMVKDEVEMRRFG